MSKFGIGPTLSSLNPSSSSSNGNQTAAAVASHTAATNAAVASNGINSNPAIENNPLSALSTIVLPPKGPLKPSAYNTDPPLLIQSSTLPIVQSSYPGSFVKQHSTHHHLAAEMPNPPIITTTLNGSNSTAKNTTDQPVTFNLPKLNKFPYYLLNLDDLEKSVCLMRTVQVPVKSLSHLTLKNDTSPVISTKTKPILVDTNDLSLSFLPGDQLIEVNDEVVIYKSLGECTKLIDRLMDEEPASIVWFKVKTCLINSELIMRNDGRHRHTAPGEFAVNVDTLKRSGSLKRKGKEVFTLWNLSVFQPVLINF